MRIHMFKPTGQYHKHPNLRVYCSSAYAVALVVRSVLPVVLNCVMSLLMLLVLGLVLLYPNLKIKDVKNVRLIFFNPFKKDYIAITKNNLARFFRSFLRWLRRLVSINRVLSASMWIHIYVDIADTKDHCSNQLFK